MVSIHLPVVVIRTTALRAEPGRAAPLLRGLNPGHYATITAGPVAANGATWWQLDGAGWCAERVDDTDILHVATSKGQNHA